MNIDQESTISSLIQSNLLLKSQIKQQEEAFSQAIARKDQETSDLQHEILSLQSGLEKELKIREFAENEAETLRNKLKKSAKSNAELLEIKEMQISKKKERHEQEISAIRAEIEEKTKKIQQFSTENQKFC